MATATPPANSQPAAPAPRRPLLPPEERFWQRYSPHNECPVSGVSSVMIYVLMFVLIVAGIKLHLFDSSNEPLPIGAVEDPGDIGGGGGDPDGAKGGTGDQRPDLKIEDIVKANPNLPALPSLDLPKEQPLDKNILPDIVAPDKVDDINYTEAVAALAKVDRSTQKLLLDTLRDQGKGGTGSGGGKGTGTGTGTGDAKGPGDKPPMNDRQRRMLRWNMVFDTRSGEDYRRQLQSLGAIVAIPDGAPDPDGKQRNFLVIRDLKPGGRPAPEDLKAINRISWIDNRQESIGNLAQALGLPGVPAFIIAFFPQELEEKLARMEEAFARNRGVGKNITETRFRIVLNGRTGKYEPMLVDQR